VIIRRPSFIWQFHLCSRRRSVATDCSKVKRRIGVLHSLVPFRWNIVMSDDKNPAYAPFFGAMGAASAMVFSGSYCASVFFCSSLHAWNEIRFETAVPVWPKTARPKGRKSYFQWTVQFTEILYGIGICFPDIWTTGWYANSQTSQLADWSTCRWCHQQ